MSSILQELEQQIAGITSSVEKTNVGTVRQVGDGVCKVEGLSDILGVRMPFKPTDFTQVNHPINRVLVGRALRLLAQAGREIGGAAGN